MKDWQSFLTTLALQFTQKLILKVSPSAAEWIRMKIFPDMKTRDQVRRLTRLQALLLLELIRRSGMTAVEIRDWEKASGVPPIDMNLLWRDTDFVEFDRGVWAVKVSVQSAVRGMAERRASRP